mmetsp:Transcript_46739/g.73167  ORF Transcript_46739/g.73167 Transcript_46739/m.73167 type:complete len:128 (+) Transcript_46739:46-429(+)
MNQEELQYLTSTGSVDPGQIQGSIIHAYEAAESDFGMSVNPRDRRSKDHDAHGSCCSFVRLRRGTHVGDQLESQSSTGPREGQPGTIELSRLNLISAFRLRVLMIKSLQCQPIRLRSLPVLPVVAWE